MGITDNMFPRKYSDNFLANSNMMCGSERSSQQFRLTSPTKRGFFGPRKSVMSSSVTRYVFNEDGKVASLLSSSDNSSVTDLSSGGFFANEPGYPQCSCTRDACYVCCKNVHCQWSGFGRARTRCPCHPTVTFLLDLPQCPRCLGPICETLDRPHPKEAADDDDDDL